MIVTAVIRPRPLDRIHAKSGHHEAMPDRPYVYGASTQAPRTRALVERIRAEVGKR